MHAHATARAIFFLFASLIDEAIALIGIHQKGRQTILRYHRHMGLQREIVTHARSIERRELMHACARHSSGNFFPLRIFD